ncbi:MAG: HAD-IA family hydrolase [Magnetococcales bacterium]|nr:HAD-IA family hydrolase [Magnetococcales bacterium]
MNVDLVIFDCDGTLTDSLDAIWQGVNRAMAAQGLSRRFSPKEVAAIVGLSLEQAFAQLLPGTPGTVSQALGQRYREQFRRMIGEGMPESPLFPGVVDTLTRLHEAGMVLGIATGKSMAGLERTLQNHNLKHYFTFFQTADSAPSKPHPAMITRILAESGLAASRTLMVGDTDFDMLMGHGAGVATCAVTYGCHDRPRLTMARPDFFIDRMPELPPLLGI